MFVGYREVELEGSQKSRKNALALISFGVKSTEKW